MATLDEVDEKQPEVDMKRIVSGKTKVKQAAEVLELDFRERTTKEENKREGAEEKKYDDIRQRRGGEYGGGKPLAIEE
jgi:hypothetical protein